MVSDINDINFREKVSESKLPVLVDFWAPWCGPCNMLTPVITELAESLAGKVIIYKMNIDQNPNIPSELGIRSIPTLVLFNQGKQLSSKLGVASKIALEEWINSII